jgi:hypothetical protein
MKLARPSLTSHEHIDERQVQCQEQQVADVHWGVQPQTTAGRSVIDVGPGVMHCSNKAPKVIASTTFDGRPRVS